jgi:pSer/pThr/pTyr-binding forkhead associated (FHA) protein/tetratricopeptide (TPR) repeat protein
VAKLVVFRGDDVERELHVGPHTIRIGRDPRNELVLDDKAVTRFHAEVVRQGATFYISDLNSRNGVWMNKQRISGKTPMELGVPVTIGVFEVTLEDDLGTADLSGVVPAAPRTEVHVAERPSAASSSSTTRGKASSSSTATSSAAATAARKPAVFWAIVGVGTLVLCLVTYGAIRFMTRRPAPAPQVAADPPPPTPTPVPDPTPATPVKEDIIAGYLEAANYAIDDKDYEAASYDIEAALELDPSNQALLDKKKQVQDLAAAPPPPVIVREKPKPVEPAVVEVAGIPRKQGESPADYNARAQRIQANMRNGMASMDQEDFTRALTLFQAVERDQPGYMNIDGLIADTTAKQKRQVDTAIDNGQQNERANNLINAIKWYERALRLDPSSAAAQGKLAAIADRRTKLGLAALEKADVYRKRQDVAKALAAYQEAADLLPSTNEKKAEAQQWVEKLKQ